MPSTCSADSGTSSESRSCRICESPITGHGNKKLCGEECRAENLRRRLALPEVKLQRAEASTRSRLRQLADPDRRAKRIAHSAAWRAANPEKRLAHERAYRAANPEVIREKQHRRRARVLNAYVAPVDIDEIWERDGGVCGICHAPIDRTLSWPNRQCLTLDHVVALADGGTHEPSNAQLAHAACNSRKGAAMQRGYIL